MCVKKPFFFLHLCLSYFFFFVLFSTFSLGSPIYFSFIPLSSAPKTCSQLLLDFSLSIPMNLMTKSLSQWWLKSEWAALPFLICSSFCVELLVKDATFDWESYQISELWGYILILQPSSSLTFNKSLSLITPTSEFFLARTHTSPFSPILP